MDKETKKVLTEYINRFNEAEQNFKFAQSIINRIVHPIDETGDRKTLILAINKEIEIQCNLFMQSQTDIRDTMLKKIEQLCTPQQ